jgi:hypothetical protein
MEDFIIIFLDIQHRDSVDTAPIRALTAPFGIKDGPVQNDRRLISPGPEFQDLGGKGFGALYFIIGSYSFHGYLWFIS